MRTRTLRAAIIPLSLILAIGCSEKPTYTPNTTGQTPPPATVGTKKTAPAKVKRPKQLSDFTGAPDGVTP
jgi:hypothetical protein